MEIFDSYACIEILGIARIWDDSMVSSKEYNKFFIFILDIKAEILWIFFKILLAAVFIVIDIC